MSRNGRGSTNYSPFLIRPWVSDNIGRLYLVATVVVLIAGILVVTR